MKNSPVISFLNKMTDLLVLNLLWLAASLPVITIGASTTAMFSVSLHSVRYGDGYVWRNFWKAFRKNFRQATLAWIMLLLIICGFLYNTILLGSFDGGVLKLAMTAVLGIFGLIFLFVGLYIFPVIAIMENPLFVHIKNCLLLAVGHMPQTLIIMAVTGVFAYVNYVSLAANVVMLVIGFALQSYVLSFFYYRAFMEHVGLTFDDFDINRKGINIL